MKIRTRFYIHGIQKKYALLTLILLASYTIILTLALFLPPSLRLNAGASLEEQAVAAAEFIALSDRLWPAILISVPIFMALSVWVTHRFAGPIYRLEKSLAQIATGDLGLQVRFRSGDDFQELAALVNQIVRQHGEALRTVQSVHQHLLKIMAQVRSKVVPQEDINPTLEQVQVQLEQIETLLRKFKLDEMVSPSREHAKA